MKTLSIIRILAMGLFVCLTSPWGLLNASAEGEAIPYLPTSEDIWYGHRSGTFPECVDREQMFGCLWYENAASQTLDFVLGWQDIPMSRLRLKMRLRWDEVAGTDLIGIRFYNGTSDAWTTLTNIGPNQSDWTNLTFDITGHIYNNSAVSIRFTGDSIGGGSQLSVLIDYIAVEDIAGLDVGDLLERIEDLEDDISRLKRRLGDLEVEADYPLPSIGYQPCECGAACLDPYESIRYWIHQDDDATPSTFYAMYPSTFSDVEVETDYLFVGGSYSRLWINDTKNTTSTADDTEILNTTAVITYRNLGEGKNITVEASGGTPATTRVVRIRDIETFAWADEGDHFGYTSVITNSMTMDWTNVDIMVAFPEEDQYGVELEVDAESVVVQDEDYDTTLEPGWNYDITLAGISMYLDEVETGVSRTFAFSFERQDRSLERMIMTIHDSQVFDDDTWLNRPYRASVYYTNGPHTSFDGEAYIYFDLQGSAFKGKELDTHSVLILKDGSMVGQYVIFRDTVVIPNVDLDPGEEVQFTLYFNMVSPGGGLVSSILGDQIAIVGISVLMMTGGFVSIYRPTSKGKAVDKKTKYRAVVLFIIGIIIFLLGLGLPYII